MPYNADLADRLRQVLPALTLNESEELGETKMFGGLCFTLNGKMLIGIDKDRLVVRLCDDDLARELEVGRVLPMDLTGRPLRNFAFVQSGSFEEDLDLLVWARLSVRFVREHMLGKPTRKRKKT